MIFLIIALVLSIGFSIFCLLRKKRIDNNIEQKNLELKYLNNELKSKCSTLEDTKNKLEKEINDCENTITEKRNTIFAQAEQINKMSDTIKSDLENQKKISSDAFDSYWEVLNNKYKETEKEFDENIANLEKAYSNLQLKLLAEADECKADLDKIKSTRAAAIEAARREKEIEADLSFYCIDISDTDKADIAKLNSLKPSLNKPRILSMLIWTTFVRDQLKSLTNNILGSGDKIGIYKITNITTKECYIGQARSVRERWIEHCKAGLGIDTPAANLLYKAMSDYGIWNFSFELLEECPIDQLNEKEKYYIDLYDSYNFGYNKTKGNK